MTIKELRDLLAEYLDDEKVFVSHRHGFLKEVLVCEVIDQDTNKGSVVIHPKLEDSELEWPDGRKVYLKRNFC